MINYNLLIFTEELESSGTLVDADQNRSKNILNLAQSSNQLKSKMKIK
jgi:serine kinase of HPr protein (carbohydrate metabolism regulator)